MSLCGLLCVVVVCWLVIGWMSLFLWDEFWLVGLVGLAWVGVLCFVGLCGVWCSVGLCFTNLYY